MTTGHRNSGRCDCGAVSYEVGAPVHVYACHCLRCQNRSGSAFAEHAMIAADDFRCTGATVSATRTSGDMQFEEVCCADCYTRLYNLNSALPGMVFLRAGTLDDSQRIAPIAHIWTARKQDWLNLPDNVPSFAGSPSPDQFREAVAAAMARDGHARAPGADRASPA